MDEDEEEESIVAYVKKIGKNDDIKSINEFIKDNVWIVPIMYIIGNICLLVRNRLYNLPFGTLSITQLSVIFTYVVAYYIVYCSTKKIIESIKIIKRNKIKYKRVVLFLLLCIILIILDSIFTIAIYCCINEFIKSIMYASFYICLICFYVLYIDKKGIVYELLIIGMFSMIILETPIYLGGFKGQKVIFYDFSTNQEKEYTYYGTNDSLYQFTDGENVYLIPTESGYIKYKYIEK